MTSESNLEATARWVDDGIALACSGPLRALRWLIDGRHARFGARLTQLSFVGGSVVGACFTDDNVYVYVAVCALCAVAWSLVTEAELHVIEAVGPDRLVDAVFPVVVFRLILVANLVAGVVLLAGGTSSYPTWSYLLNVGAIAGSYLMYLPESPFGRRSFVARSVERFARSGALAPGMA